MTRRRFLGVGIGTGLFALGVGSWACSSGRGGGSPSGLQIFEQGYPRGLFFRQTEVDARGKSLSYEEWEKRYFPLNGIVGKALDEVDERVREAGNSSYFLRYKENNPGKTVLLHYHGAGRRAPNTITAGFFAGHWLHHAGTNSTRPVAASLSATVAYVAGVPVFSLGRVPAVRDDIAIVPPGDNGEPDWESAEQVKLEEIDAGNGTITVKRGAYGPEPRFYPESSHRVPESLANTAPASCGCEDRKQFPSHAGQSPRCCAFRISSYPRATSTLSRETHHEPPNRRGKTGGCVCRRGSSGILLVSRTQAAIGLSLRAQEALECRGMPSKCFKEEMMRVD
ncbi:MAG: hypothetical protein M3122_00465 [Actinomycetota bacterium]|nr:hypothetical protein [Actinomycetota bacterium]